MTSPVEPEEAQAILDAVQTTGAAAPVQVAPRDFGKPLRLSPGELEASRRAVQTALAEGEKTLARELRALHGLSLVELSEISAEGLFAELAAPFAIVRFEMGGQPGWARWDIAGAVLAIETALGTPEPTNGERGLTGVERHILERLLGGLSRQLAAALGLEIEALTAVEKLDDVGSWREGGATADRQRLRVSLSIDGPGGASGIDLFLPGMLGSGATRRGIDLDDLPPHLAEVTIEIAAHLGSCEVAFGDLLELEEGDVIPLAAPVDADLRVIAEEIEFASARLGQRGGRLAIEITRVGSPDATENPPS